MDFAKFNNAEARDYVTLELSDTTYAGYEDLSYSESAYIKRANSKLWGFRRKRVKIISL